MHSMTFGLEVYLQKLLLLKMNLWMRKTLEWMTMKIIIVAQLETNPGMSSIHKLMCQRVALFLCGPVAQFILYG